MSNEHLNYEQMGLTVAHANSLTTHKGMRQLLYHVIENSPTRVIGAKSGTNHMKLYFENDGLLAMSSSPSDMNAIHMADRQIRKSLGSHGLEYQTMKDFSRKKKKQKDSPEEPPAE
jgi:hypothetical protein